MVNELNESRVIRLRGRGRSIVDQLPRTGKRASLSTIVYL